MKAFGVYRRSYITEEGNLTGLEKHFKIEIRGIFFNVFNFGSQDFLFSLKNFLVDVLFNNIFFFNFKLKSCGSVT